MSTSLVRTSVFRFPLDIHQSQSQVSVTAGLHEDGIRLVIRLMENGAPFDIHHAARAEFSAVRPDGEPIMNPCMIFGQGTVVYDFTGEEVLYPGVMPCQIFLYNPDGGLILSPKFHIVVHENAAADGEEVGAQEQYKTLKKFVEEISAVQNVLGTLHEEIYGDLDPNFNYNKDHPYDPNYEINNYHSRIDVLEAARPVTGAFSIPAGSWTTGVDGGYWKPVPLQGDPVQSGDVVLVLPDDEQTRVASADMEVRVIHDVLNGESFDTLQVTSKTLPAVDLYYRYVVIKKAAADTELTANAIIIGVNDVPQYVKDKLAEIEAWQETAMGYFLNLFKVTGDNTSAIEALSVRIDELPQAGGGASASRGSFVITADKWSDASPTMASVDLPKETLVEGDVMLVSPADNATRNAAVDARLVLNIDHSGDYGELTDTVMLARATTGVKPTVDMTFVYAVLHTDSDASALVTLVGVDAVEKAAPTSIDLTALDPVEQDDGRLMGYIVETFGEEDGAPTETTELTYDDAGNIVSIKTADGHVTELKWKEAE